MASPREDTQKKNQGNLYDTPHCLFNQPSFTPTHSQTHLYNKFNETNNNTSKNQQMEIFR